MRAIKKFTIVAVCIVAAILLLKKCNVLPSLDRFKAKPVVIDETPILIKEIKAIGQLITFSSFDEVVSDSIIVTRGSQLVNAFNFVAPVPLLPSADKQLVLIGRGRVLAGVDLALLNDTSIAIINDTVRLYLPQAQIFDAILNPADFETFVEKGEWSSAEVTQVKVRARQKMIDRALKQNIVEKAGTKAKAVMEDFLRNMGYKTVYIF